MLSINSEKPPSLQLLRELFPGRLAINIEEMCPLLGISAGTARNQLFQGRFPIPTRKVGGRRIISLTDIAQFLDGNIAHQNLPAPQKKKKRGRPKNSERFSQGANHERA